MIGRLATRLTLFAEAKAALADVDVSVKALPPRVVDSIRRAFAYPPVGRRTQRRPHKKR
jgi:hypothetical protein